ncbi:hypothetical protein H105_07819 [Trichophyton soudanense CBS 452.61]|uniref:BAG domain-containing protein n=1 Tax=Trichophyton soudanense CBS 452.61 TaxID=1215331 RepID=A0A022XGN5_TRISD|nr:hypothetical protein H105_07819 [Trichophyton soudanense CBS 452.61]
MASRRGHRRSGLWDIPLDHDLYASSPYYSSPAPSSPYDPYGYATHFDPYGPGTPSSSGSNSYYLTTPRVYSNGDISQAEARMRAQQLAAPSPEDGELPDILIFKYQNESWSFEFPAFSIDDDRLCVSDIRRLAGQTLNIADISRIKLMYKGRLMTDDAASAKSQGLKQFSEVVAIVMPGYTEGVYGGSSGLIDGWREAQLIPVSDSEEDDEQPSLQPPPPPLQKPLQKPQQQQQQQQQSSASRPRRPPKVKIEVRDDDELEDERYYYKPSPVRRGRSPPKYVPQERRKSVRRERKPRDPSPVSPDRKPRRRPVQHQQHQQQQPPVQPVQPVREPASPKEPISPREKIYARQTRPPSPPKSKYQYPAVPPYPSPPPAAYDPLPNICREPRPYATSHPSPSVSSTVSSSTYTSDSASTAASTAASFSPTVPSSIPAPTKPKPKPKANKTYSVPNRPPTPCPPFLASHSTSDKLTIFEKYVNDKLIPLCTRFIMHPPADVRAQNKEQRRLSEAMERVLARADEITVGTSRPLRDRRKAVVQMVQRFQTRIDAMIVPE